MLIQNWLSLNPIVEFFFSCRVACLLPDGFHRVFGKTRTLSYSLYEAAHFTVLPFAAQWYAFHGVGKLYWYKVHCFSFEFNDLC